MGSRVYLALTLALYAVGAAHVLLQTLTRRRLFTTLTLAATLAGFALHTAGISQRWTEGGHFPAVGLQDAASLLAWCVVLILLAVYLRTRVEALGLALHPVAFLLLLVANFGPAAARDRAVLTSVFLPVHIGLAFSGYAALLVAFAMGVLYLIQERELKARTPRTFYYLAPSLERCDTLGGRSAVVGFVLLSLAIVTGVLWSHSVHGRYWTWDAKNLSAAVAWGIYVVMVVARHRSGWGGRRAAWLGIAGFAAVAVTFVSATLFTASVTPSP